MQRTAGACAVLRGETSFWVRRSRIPYLPRRFLGARAHLEFAPVDRLDGRSITLSTAPGMAMRRSLALVGRQQPVVDQHLNLGLEDLQTNEVRPSLPRRRQSSALRVLQSWRSMDEFTASPGHAA